MSSLLDARSDLERRMLLMGRLIAGRATGGENATTAGHLVLDALALAQALFINNRPANQDSTFAALTGPPAGTPGASSIRASLARRFETRMVKVESEHDEQLLPSLNRALKLLDLSPLLPTPGSSELIYLEAMGVLSFVGPPRLVADADGQQRVERWAVLRIRDSLELLWANAHDLSMDERRRIKDLTFLIRQPIWSPNDDDVYLAVFPRALREDWNGPIVVRAAALHRDGSPSRGEVHVDRVWAPGEDGSNTRHQSRVWGSVAHHLYRPTAPPALLTRGAPSPTSIRNEVFDRIRAGSAGWLPGDGQSWPLSWTPWVEVRYRTRNDDDSGTLGYYDLRGGWVQHPEMLPASEQPKVGGAPWRKQMGSIDLGITVDFGATTSCITEHEQHRQGVTGPLGTSYSMHHGPERPAGWRLRSGWLQLGGPKQFAHRAGCGEWLALQSGYLPTRLVFPSESALNRSLEPQEPNLDATLQTCWLPQSDQGRLDSTERTGAGPRTVGWFKAPSLLEVERPGATREVRELASERWSQAWFRLLGSTLAAGYASQGAPMLPWPHMGLSRTVLTYPDCMWSEPGSDSDRKMNSLIQSHHRSLREGLEAAWPTNPQFMYHVSESVAASRKLNPTTPCPIQIFADLGGFTLDLLIKIRDLGRGNRPQVSATTMSYRIGGEVFLRAWALHETVRNRQDSASYRNLIKETRRKSIESEETHTDHLRFAELLPETFGQLLRCHLEAALRLADTRSRWPNPYVQQDASIVLTGQGWLLSGLGVQREDDRRSAALENLKGVWQQLKDLVHINAPDAVQYLTKADLCIGAWEAVMADQDNARESPPFIRGANVRLGGHNAPRRPWWSTVRSEATKPQYRDKSAGTDLIERLYRHNGRALRPASDWGYVWAKESFPDCLLDPHDPYCADNKSYLVTETDHCGPTRLVLRFSNIMPPPGVGPLHQAPL